LTRQFQPSFAGVRGSSLGAGADGAVVFVEEFPLNGLQMGGSQLHRSGTIFWGGLIFGQASL